MESKWLYRATFWQMGEWFIKSLDIFILIFALATSSIERWSTYVIVIIFCVLWIYLNFYKKKKMELLYFLDKNRHVVIFYLQSACVPCDIGHYQCPDGYTVESGTTTKGCVYSSGESQYKGCSSLCSREQTV